MLEYQPISHLLHIQQLTKYYLMLFSFESSNIWLSFCNIVILLNFVNII